MNLLEQYILARWCYATGQECEYSLSDIEYRVLEEAVQKEFPNNEYLKRSWSNDPCPIELLKKYDLMNLYVDMKFEHTSESIPSINNMDQYRSILGPLNKRSRLSFKLDGWNTQVNYYNGKRMSAETRGRSGNSLNANVVLNIVPEQIKHLGMVKVTGECVIPNALWPEYKERTGNRVQRNSVRTAFANGDTEVLAFVAFNIQFEDGRIIEDKYSLLQELGFLTPMNFFVSNFSQLDVAVRKLCSLKEKYKFPTDGLVIENEDMQRAIRVYAYQEDLLHSYVTGISERIGFTGRSIVADIKPVVIEGSKKTCVNITNLSYAYAYNLVPGAPIAFTIRSATNCVLNEVGTKLLQAEWKDNWEGYKEEIDRLKLDED